MLPLCDSFCIVSLFYGADLSVFSKISNPLAEEERQLVALLKLYYGCMCHVSLPQGAMGCSAVRNCRIFQILTSLNKCTES